MISRKIYRCEQGSNLRGETPLDFKSNALTTRPSQLKIHFHFIIIDKNKLIIDPVFVWYVYIRWLSNVIVVVRKPIAAICDKYFSGNCQKLSAATAS